MAELENLVKSVNKNSVLVGDFNMPDIEWETWTGTKKTAGFLDAVEDALLEQLVDFPTHIKGNCLDLVLTNIPERIFEIKEAGRLGSSDHEMICFTIGMQNGPKREERSGLNWKKADWTNMKTDLARIDWGPSLQDMSAQDMWIFFKSKVEETVRKHVPARKLRKGGRAAWMTKEIMAAVRKKKKLWKRAKEGQNMEEYREADRNVKKMIRNAKRNFEKKLSTVQGGNTRPFYSYVKKKTKSRPSIGPLLDTNNCRISDDKGMADLLNGFFSSVFTREDLQNQPAAEDMGTETLEKVRVTERLVKENFFLCRTRRHWPTAASRTEGRSGTCTNDNLQTVAEIRCRA